MNNYTIGNGIETILIASSVVPIEFFDAGGMPTVIIEYNPRLNSGAKLSDVINIDGAMNGSINIELSSMSHLTIYQSDGSSYTFRVEINTSDRPLYGAYQAMQTPASVIMAQFIEAMSGDGSNSRFFSKDLGSTYQKFHRSGREAELNGALSHVSSLIMRFEAEFGRKPGEFDIVMYRNNNMLNSFATNLSGSNVGHIALVSGLVHDPAGNIVDLGIVETYEGMEHINNRSLAVSLMAHTRGDVYIVAANLQGATLQGRSEMFQKAMISLLSDDILYNIGAFALHTARLASSGLNRKFFHFRRNVEGRHSYTCAQLAVSILIKAGLIPDMHTSEVANYNILLLGKDGILYDMRLHNEIRPDEDWFLFRSYGLRIVSKSDKGISFPQSSIARVAVICNYNKINSRIPINYLRVVEAVDGSMPSSMGGGGTVADDEFVFFEEYPDAVVE